jgi:hypothetical protein
METAQLRAVYERVLSDEERAFLRDEHPGDDEAALLRHVGRLFYLDGSYIVGPERFATHWSFLRDNTFPTHAATGERLTFVRSLAIESTQMVFLVADRQRQKWVVKLVPPLSESRTVSHEESDYDRIDALGGQTPRRRSGFFYLGVPALVIEYLDPLDDDDDPREVGRQLLTTQLRFIHTFGVHCDLKPDNIRKRAGATVPRYFIIDMDLDTIAEPPVLGRYRRDHWTPFYASQMVSYNRYTSYRADLVELGYVMAQMVMRRQYHLQRGIFEPWRAEHVRRLLGLREGDVFADVETTRAAYEGKDMPLRVARALNELVKMPDGLPFDRGVAPYTTESGYITQNYFRQVAELPEYNMPPGIHERLAYAAL